MSVHRKRGANRLGRVCRSPALPPAPTSPPREAPGPQAAPAAAGQPGLARSVAASFWARHWWLGAILLLLVVGLFAVFRGPVRQRARLAVEVYGLPALFVLTWASDVVPQPVPADVLVFGTTFGGGHLIEAALVAGLASALGGLTAWTVGRVLGPRVFRRVGRHWLRAGRDLFRHYGSLAIVVAAVTPIPYSAACWVGGIYGMSAWRLFLASLVARTLRYLVIGWLGSLM